MQRLKNLIKSQKISWQNIFLAAIFTIFGAFAAQSIFFALKVPRQVPPDEGFHIQLIQEYSETLGKVENQPDTYWMQDITRKAYLYHWIGGRIVNLNITPIDDFVILRMFNSILSMTTLAVVYFISREVFEKKLPQLLTVTMTANTLMFVFLSGGVNYDNLANLLFAFAVLFWLKSVRTKRAIYTLSMAATMLLATLTKLTALPFSLFLGLIWLISEFKSLTVHLSNFVDSLKNKPGTYYLGGIILLLIVLIGLNISLYGTNIVKYKSIDPSCTRILKEEQCNASQLYLRDKDAALKGQENPQRINILRFGLVWSKHMVSTTYGILAHRSISKTETLLLPYGVIFLIAGINFIRRKRAKIPFFLLAMTISYALFLFLFNYRSYLKTGVLLGAQGRYLFPVLIPGYVGAVYFLLKWKNKTIKYLVFAATAVVFVLGNIPFFIIAANSQNFL
jgi:hypothetical protein